MSMPVLITKSVPLFHCGGVHKIIICIISDVCLVPRHPHHTIHLSSQSYMVVEDLFILPGSYNCKIGKNLGTKL